MAGDRDIINTVRREKQEFESQVEEDSIKTQNELIRMDELIPVSQIKSKTVLSLFENYYEPEVFNHLNIETDKIKKLSNALTVLTKNAIKSCGPLLCLGPKCFAADRCPIQKASVAPIGHPCCIELMLIDQWEEEYIVDLDIDRQSKVELDLVHDMIESDLIDWRTSHEIAKNGLFDWNAIGMTEDGKPITRKEESVAIGIKLKFKSRKDKIREDLMATRKMKAKFGLARSIDPSKFASALQDRYNAIRKATVVDDEDENSDENPSEQAEE